MGAFLALPDTPPDVAVPAVIAIHEVFGLNDDIRRVARRFAANGYAAFAPDLLDIGGPRLLCISRAMRALSLGALGGLSAPPPLPARRGFSSSLSAVWVEPNAALGT